MHLRKPNELALKEPTVVRYEELINKSTVVQLLAAAVQKFGDAQRKENSGPTRLETAYDAILYCALALFAAQGYRLSSSPGHHRVALEGMAAELSLSVSIYEEIRLLLDLRNTKYTGFLNVSPADLKIAMQLGERVLNETELWVLKNRPNFLKAA